MPIAERTWEIEDARGKRRVTLAEFRAEIDAFKPVAKRLVDAVRRGDLVGAGEAQAACRAHKQARS